MNQVVTMKIGESSSSAQSNIGPLHPGERAGAIFAAKPKFVKLPVKNLLTQLNLINSFFKKKQFLIVKGYVFFHHYLKKDHLSALQHFVKSLIKYSFFNYSLASKNVSSQDPTQTNLHNLTLPILTKPYLT